MTGPRRSAHDPAADLLPGEVARPLKALGLLGYVLLLIAIALIGMAISAAALGWALTGWVAGAVVCTALALACLVGGRAALTTRRRHDRAEHDPLIPEVTAEEAADYRRHHPHPPVPPAPRGPQ
ncbi:hypothetical protein [Gordonia sp. FQ]|uniref:hypothetical protein n=1 Tax=Gordonia sp. FQ TaxID=3446634 RepID=UPI003F83983D